MRWVEISINFEQFDNSVGSKVMMLVYQSLHTMMHNVIADVWKGGDLFKKSFEQSNLVNNMRSFTYKL